MEEYFKFKYYQEIFAVVFAGLVIVVLALIYFIGTIIDKIKLNKRFRKIKKENEND